MIIQINLEFCSLIRTFAAIMVANQQESTPMVSFIITYYELPVKLLCECLDSIFALSLSDQERQVIIVDDGSENSPLPALQRYADKVIYLRQKHQGLSVARNTGIQMATGKYLQFVDADDLLVKAGYALSHGDKRDIVVEYCLMTGRYNVTEINEILFKLDLQPLGY